MTAKDDARYQAIKAVKRRINERDQAGGGFGYGFIEGFNVAWDAAMSAVSDVIDDAQPRGQYEHFDDHLVSARFKDLSK